MSRFRTVPKPSILRHAARSRPGGDERETVASSPRGPRGPSGASAPRLTFTGAIGALCMFPLRAIISACVALRIHPNTLTLVGVIVNVGAAWALGYNRFRLAFVIMLVANIFDFIDGKV